jgi:hypothetical protein
MGRRMTIWKTGGAKKAGGKKSRRKRKGKGKGKTSWNCAF